MTISRYNRREFMGVTGAALAGLGASRAIAAGAPTAQVALVGGQDPNLMVINAKVYTMDPRAPRAEAFAVTGGRFVGGRLNQRHQGTWPARTRRPSMPRA